MPALITESMKWTNSQIDTLNRLWMQGTTASQIAETLGTGITRHAVLGKLHRLGRSAVDDAGSKATNVMCRDIAKDSCADTLEKSCAEGGPCKAPDGVDDDIAEFNTTEQPAALVSPVTIGALTDDMCRWPIDDPEAEEFLYCGALVSGGAPYCTRHSKLAYQASSPLRRPLDRKDVFPGIVPFSQKA